jgi:hypothetical protein
MRRPKFAWGDYFGGNQEPTHSQREYDTQQTPSVTSVYVSNCLFNGCISTSNGGALSCTSVTYLLVESSSFFSCRTSSSNGGAINFVNTNNGQFVIYGVCCNDCYSTITGTSRGQFAYTEVKYDVSFKNYVNYSSIARCVNERSYSYFTMRLEGGKTCCPSINMSLTKCQRYSIINCRPFADLKSVTSSISYSSFVDNKAFDYICIAVERTTKCEIKCCNILRNTQDSSSSGMIWTHGNLMIEDSCILENTATYIFYVTSSSYAITLSNCTFDKTSNNGYLTIQNTVTKNFILGLNHMSTLNCHHEYDSAGTLTAIPYVSHTTKKVIYYTFNHCQARISDFFSLNWVFMVTFIYKNPSGDY